jgi:hypothetical protein
MSAWMPSTRRPEAVSSMFSVTDMSWDPERRRALMATWSSIERAKRSILVNDDGTDPAVCHALLLCQAATAVKRPVGRSIDVMVLNTTLVMCRFKARSASVLVMPSARFLSK